MVKRFTKRDAGRNICRFGVKHSSGRVSKATFDQKRRYLLQLRSLVAAPPYLATRPIMPAQRPADTMSVAYAPIGVAACIVHNESRGDPLAQNGQYKGIAQWSPEAWARHGGLRYARSPRGASYQQQLMVLSSGLSRYGCRDWCQWDGCG